MCNRILILFAAACSLPLCGAEHGSAWERNPKTESLLRSLELTDQALYHVAFEKDAKGGIRYVWIASSKGLFQYDGFDTRQFTTSDGLPSDFVRSVLVTRNGTLWVATNNGAGTFDGKKFSSQGSEAALAGPNVRRIIEDREGTVWFASDSWGVPNAKGGLTSLRGGQWRVWRSTEGLPSDYLVDEYTDSTGRKFAMTLNGPARLVGERWMKEPVPALPAGTNWGSGVIAEAPGVGLVMSSGSAVWVLRGDVWVPLGKPPDHKHGMAVTHDGKILIAGATKQKTRAFFEWTGAEWKRVSDEFRVSQDWAIFLTEAPDGSVWYAGMDCLQRWSRGNSEWQFMPGATGRQFLDSNDRLWMHSSDGTLSEFDGEQWIKRGVYSSVSRQRADSVWGIQNRSLTSWRAGRPQVFSAAETGIAEPLNVTVDSQGLAWVVGNNGSGQGVVASYDGRMWRRQTRAKVGRFVRAAAIPGGGMAYLTVEETSGPVRLWFSAEPENTIPLAEAVAGHFNIQLTAHSKDEVLAYGESGLHRWRRGKGWAEIPSLPSRRVTSVEEQDGVLWMVTNGALGGQSGLYRTSMDGSQSKFFPTEGLIGLTRSAGGFLMAGGNGQFYVMSPGKDSEPFEIRLPGNPVLSSVNRDSGGAYWVATSEGTFRFHSDGVPRHIEISALGNRILSGQPFAAVADGWRRFSTDHNPAGMRFSWRMDNELWGPFSSRFHYQTEGTGLSRGKHTVAVRYQDNGLLEEGAATATLDFQVEAQPIQNQVWFAPGLILATIAMALSSLVAIAARRKLARQSKQLIGMSEQRYRQIVETSHEGIATYDRAGTCTMANEEYSRILGLPLERIVGQSFRSTVDPAVFEVVMERHRNGGEKTGSYEMELRTPQGVKQVEVTCRPMLMGSDNSPGTLTTLSDITSRKMAEAAIRQNEVNYRNLFESSPNPRMLVDRETLCFYRINDSACEVYGYSREEFSRITMRDLQVPGGEEQSLQLFAGEAFPGPVVRQHRRKDGQIIDVETYAHDQEFEGRPCRQILTIDKTRQQLAAKRLNESEQALALAQRIANVGSFLVTIEPGSAASQTRQWSAEMYRIMGVEPGSMPVEALEFRRFVHPDDLEELFEMRSKALRDGTPGECEHRIIRHDDGAIRFVRTNVRPMPGHEQPTLICTVQDMTEYRALQEQLQQAQRLDSVGRLAGGVAHDFNNLLTVINGYSKLILKKQEPGTRLYNDIQQIAEAGKEAAELTKRLLAFGRKQTMKAVPLNLNEVVKDATGLLTRVVGEDIQLVTELNSVPVMVRADPVQMNQVLLNLTTNARDAMPRGGRLTIATDQVLLDDDFVEAHPEATAGWHARLVVSDNGAGMDAEMQKRIFEPFFTTKDRTGGTGLGLATVYGIIKQTGGSIELESAVGRGTTFHIYVPSLGQDAGVGQGRGVSDLNDARETAAKRGGDKMVLLVEDQHEVRRYIAGILVEQGYRVIEAANGKEVLTILEALQEGPDVMLTDVVMPGMTGFELVQEIAARYQGRTLPVVYMSGYADGKLDAAGAPASGIQLLEKPFAPEDLLTQVGQAVFGRLTEVSR